MPIKPREGKAAHVFDKNNRGDHHHGDDNDNNAGAASDAVEFLCSGVVSSGAS